MTPAASRALAALSWVRARITHRRLTRALVAVLGFSTLAITGEAIVRGRLVPPAERAPSALYTRAEAWGNSGGDGDGEDGASDSGSAAVMIGSLDPALNEERVPVTLRDVPQHLVDAVLAVEDQRFFQHHGLDPRRIAGAMFANVRARGIAEGGSTITQQLAKNLYLSASRTPIRKVREAALATALELRHSKQEILEAYLNEAYFGQDGPAAIRGVGAASRYYFGKPVRNVSLAEAALLAGMIRAPNRLAPTRHADDARERRDLVLGLMAAQGRIDSATAVRARRARVPTRAHPARVVDARYFRDFVAADAGKGIPARGVAIHTTLDAALQRGAVRAVRDGLARLGRPGAQAALVAIDPRTGDVLAMVGGRNYDASQFNRAAYALRQPGSAFKPLVALAALEAGRDGKPAFTLASMVQDEPLSVPTPQGAWQPVDYDGTYRGEVTFREALEQSLNVPFARIGLAIGPDRIVATARRLGITSPLHAVPSIALGSNEVSLLELVRAYGVFAAGGNLAATRTLLDSRTPGAAGAARESRAPHAPRLTRVADPAAAFLVTSALMGVVQHGTGRALGAEGLDGDFAGKTGTSNDWRDAWFIAYSPTIVVGAWVGNDDGTSLRLAGAAAALPIVAAFLSRAEVPGESFEVPDGVEHSYASSNGWGWCGDEEYFLEGTAPATGGCGFRAAGDDALRALRRLRGLGDLRDEIRRMIMDRLREERDLRRDRGDRPR
ncbi:MAG: transglycosylase domain-containing protein [Gemmatimonadota bacterium]|nr:transglycosylase domain-containing protein [Gemmatimonadota bacterium]